MQYLIEYSFAAEKRNDAEARFKETGALPPDGVTLVGRWHDPTALRGAMVVESSDFLQVARYVREWTDLMTFRVSVVVGDQQLGEIIGD